MVGKHVEVPIEGEGVRIITWCTTCIQVEANKYVGHLHFYKENTKLIINIALLLYLI